MNGISIIKRGREHSAAHRHRRIGKAGIHMICKKCGCKLADNVKFCTSCGEPIRNEKTDSKNTNTDLKQEKVSKKKKGSLPKGKWNPWVIATIAGIFIILAGVFAVQMVILPQIEKGKIYKEAVYAFGEGNYREAAEGFDLLDTYKDAKMKWEESSLEYAKETIKEENSFQKAVSILKEIEEAEKEKQVLGENYQNELKRLKEQAEKIQQALDFINTKQDYQSAYTILKELLETPYIQKLLEQCENEKNKTTNDNKDEDFDWDKNRFSEASTEDDWEPENGWEEEETTDEEEGFLFAYSDTSKIPQRELEKLTQRELSIARNEIYARHGHAFDSVELQEYFDEKDWYSNHGKKYDYTTFPDIEKENIDTIKEVENDLYGGSYKWN